MRVVIFFDIVDLENTTAAMIRDAFLNNIKSNGFHSDFLSRNWISFACDGASNLLGRHAGVAQLLLQMYPQLIVWHCSNHRLEIAVNDTVREMSTVCHMQSFFDKLYSVYSVSPKNKSELETVAAQLSMRLNTIGRVLGTTRWVSSSARSVRAIWNNYPALYKHFHNASVDPKRTGRERAQYSGLKRKLSDVNFVLNMGLLFDALTELEHLSLKLQEKKITLPEAHHLVLVKYHVFQSMANNPGEYYSEVLTAADKLEFKGVSLEHGKVQKISEQQFFQKLSDNINTRMFTTRASHESTGSSNTTWSNRDKYSQLLDNLKIMDKAKWVKCQDPCFADKEIRELAESFMVCTKTSVHGFHEYNEW